MQRTHRQMTVVESQPHDDLSSIQGVTQSPSIMNWPHDLWGLKAVTLDLTLMMATWINILIFNQNMIAVNRSVILNRMSIFLFLLRLWGMFGKKRLLRKKKTPDIIILYMGNKSLLFKTQTTNQHLN